MDKAHTLPRSVYTGSPQLTPIHQGLVFVCITTHLKVVRRDDAQYSLLCHSPESCAP